MLHSSNRSTTARQAPSPTWDVALLFPRQGEWSESEFLELDSRENRLIELDDGVLEILPMPDLFHQGIVGFLFRRLDAEARRIGIGEVFMAPLPIRLWENQLREPDIMLIKKHRIKDRHTPPDGADLVMEVVSPGKKNRERDLQRKRRVYAKGKIAEYWIIDPLKRLVMVLALSGTKYRIHGTFKVNQQATSKLLPDFQINVSELLAAGEGNSR